MGKPSIVDRLLCPMAALPARNRPARGGGGGIAGHKRGFGQVLTQPALALGKRLRWEHTTLIASGDDSTDSSVCWMRATAPVWIYIVFMKRSKHCPTEPCRTFSSGITPGALAAVYGGEGPEVLAGPVIHKIPERSTAAKYGSYPRGRDRPRIRDAEGYGTKRKFHARWNADAPRAGGLSSRWLGCPESAVHAAGGRQGRTYSPSPAPLRGSGRLGG